MLELSVNSLALVLFKRWVCVLLQVPNLVFLAVSPEEKESWVNALNVAIVKAKNRVLDEVIFSLRTHFTLLFLKDPFKSE